jgi:tetratricopeptide (TPR) repeat protein
MADSEKIRALLDQGLTAYGLGNVDEALQAWRSVLAIDPENNRAKEYLRFVEENWGPRQKRQGDPEGIGEPYRPDEGSGEIATPEEISAPKAPEDHGGFEKGAFTPPAKPILQGEQWGDLYDFGKREPTAAEAKTAAPPVAEKAFEKPEPAPELKPDRGQIAPLAGDWSNVLTPEEKAQPSTLPPHPEEALEEIEIVEELKPEVDSVPPDAQTREPEPTEQAAADDSMKRDELTATRKYDSVPTVVRPTEEALPAGALPAQDAPAPPVESQEVSRDSLERFPVDPEPPAAPEPPRAGGGAEGSETGPGFFQTPRPETTPPLGSPILPADGGDLLDLVEGNGGIASETAAVPGIAAVSEIDSLLKGAGDLLELDDFSGAIELLDKVLEQEPGHSQAQRMRSEAERELLSMLSSKLGDLNRTPRVRMSQDEIIWLNLDNRAGFILSLVDGSLSLDEIISICGLPQLEGMRILVQLFQEKVIEFS